MEPDGKRKERGGRRREEELSGKLRLGHRPLVRKEILRRLSQVPGAPGIKDRVWGERKAEKRWELAREVTRDLWEHEMTQLQQVPGGQRPLRNSLGGFVPT
jgi:hypothetical protein